MLSIFAAKCKTVAAPVTIVADDADEALQIFRIWQEHHAPTSMTQKIRVSQLTELDLALQPQLYAAVSLGHKGIAWWVGHREGWCIAAPQDEPAGRIAPPVPPVCCYAFPDTEDFGMVYAFAETQERAIATLHLLNLERLGWEAVYGKVVELSPWLLTGEKITLREEMFSGRSGVAEKAEDGEWHIVQADRRATSGRRIRRLL